MRMQEITAEQYLAILNSGGDALASSVKLNKKAKAYELSRLSWDKRYNPTSWAMWAGGGGNFNYFYAAVEWVYMQLVQITKEQYLALMEAGCPAHSGNPDTALAPHKQGQMDQHFKPWPDLWKKWAEEYGEFWTCVE